MAHTRRLLYEKQTDFWRQLQLEFISMNNELDEEVAADTTDDGVSTATTLEDDHMIVMKLMAELLPLD